jgi:hypothetical protein
VGEINLAYQGSMVMNLSVDFIFLTGSWSDLALSWELYSTSTR